MEKEKPGLEAGKKIDKPLLVLCALLLLSSLMLILSLVMLTRELSREEKAPLPYGLDQTAQIVPELRLEDRAELYSVTVANAAAYASPGDLRAGQAELFLPGGTQLYVLSRTEEYCRCMLAEDGPEYCVACADLSPGSWYPSADNAVDLRMLMPDAVFDILFASERNVTGHAMYPAIPLMEKETAQMLLRAHDVFLRHGFLLRICDAYRPKSAQFELYDIVRDSRFIANPRYGNSWHNVGRACDISLIDAETGRELEMPTPMHTFDLSAARFSSAAWSEEARQNVDYMTQVMESCGFGTIPTEWWHFETQHAGAYMSPELDYDALSYVPG